MKMLALTGVSTAQPGNFIVTDDNNLAIPNLNSHCLLRKSDVGKSKVEGALAAAKKINPDLRSQRYKLVGNEDVFNDDFWEELDLVINGVDNRTIRSLVDCKCVFYEKPLLVSRTSGLTCNSQVIIPHFIQDYGEASDTTDPIKYESLICRTMRESPTQIEHIIYVAINYFEGNFVEGPNELKKFIESPDSYVSRLLAELKERSWMIRYRVQSK